MRITLNDTELFTIAHIIDHFTDYMAMDDRPDHGLGVLKQYREMTNEQKSEVFQLAGKLIRARRKRQRIIYDNTIKALNENRSKSI